MLASRTSSADGAAFPTPGAATASSTSATTSARTTLPERAPTFDVAGLDPCTLTAAAQQATLGINRPPQGPNANTPVPGSTQCGFIVPNPTTGYGVSAGTSRNAAALADSARSTTVEPVGGVGSVVIDGNSVGCSYALDTSDATNVFIGSTSQRSIAAIDRPKAKAVAEAVVVTLPGKRPTLCGAVATLLTKVNTRGEQSMLITMADGGGSGSGSGGAAPGTPGSMAIEVDPDRLYATAHQFDTAANKLTDWIQTHRDEFSVASAGADSVSKGIADFFTTTATDPGGALDQATNAANNLAKVAEAMRTAAKSYGLTDTTAAGDLTSIART